MTHMLLRYVEDEDAHEIMPVIALIGHSKKKIGSTVEYRHPDYGTEFQRILVHIGSMRNCKEYEAKLIEQRRNPSSHRHNTDLPSAMLRQIKVEPGGNLTSRRMLRSVKVEKKSTPIRSTKSISRKSVKERTSVVPVIKSHERTSSNRSSPDSQQPYASPFHNSFQSTPSRERDSQSDDRNRMNFNTEVLDILRFLKANVTATPSVHNQYNGIDYIPKEEVIEINEEHSEDTEFVRVLLDTIYSEEEKDRPLNERDPLRLAWVKEQFRILKSPHPKDFIRKWNECLRRYRYNIVRRAKGGYRSIIRSKVDSE